MRCNVYKPIWMVILLLGVGLVISRPVTAQAKYSVTDLGTLGGSWSVAYSLNNRGQVVGSAETAAGVNHAYVWDSVLGMSDLGTLPGYPNQSYAATINENGQILGISFVGDYPTDSRVFLWQNGAMTDVGTLPGYSGSDEGSFNSAGEIAAHATNGYGGGQYIGRPFLWQNGVQTEINIPNATTASFGASGDLYGTEQTADGYFHTYLFAKGVTTDLGTLPGYGYSYSYPHGGCNASNQVTGISYSYFGNVFSGHAFLWTQGTMKDLGTLGGAYSYGVGVNDSGTVVGFANTADGSVHAFVYANGTMQDLNNLIPQNAGCVLNVAYAMNINGQIVGNGVINGHTHAILLTPVATDTTAPTTTAALSGSLGGSGWYTGPVQVSLSATDPDGSADVAATYYTVDGGAPQTYSAPFQVSSDKVHTVTFWSVDKAGNEELPHKSQTINIDGTAPTLTFGTPTPSANATGWNNTAVDIPYTTADNLSGVASASPGSPLHFGSEGKNLTQTVTVTDVAGNIATFTSPAVNIDMTPPTSSASLSGAKGSNGWYSSAVQLTLSATDNASGIGSTYYTVDGGAQQTYSGPFTVSGAAQHTVRFWSVDQAGNTETAQSQVINIDATAPVITASANSNVLWPPNGKMVSVVISGTITDSLSGADISGGTFGTVDSYGQVQPAGAFTIGTGGNYSFTVQLEAARNGQDKNGRTYTITVKARDSAGNPGTATVIVTVPHDQR